MKKNNLIDLIVLIFIFLFLLSFFKPGLLLSATTTTGGDTASHYPTAVYLKEVLLPAGKILGWDQGNYAGYPIFYHYFPLSFILMALLNFLIPMQVAFKLVSVLGTFLLPLCVYGAFRFLKYKFPIPIAAAAFSLAFLFMEANSMWGGNIPSTLAGEFSYSLSLALMILFFGSIYSGIQSKDKIIFNSILIFLIGLSHGYTLIGTGVIAAFFLFTRKDFWENFKYLFKVFGLGVMLLAFWLLPFIGNLAYVTSYVARWQIASIFEAAPLVLIPFFTLSAFSFFFNRGDRRTHYFAYLVAASLIIYYLSPRIGMLDIRWIPVVQIFLVIFGATLLCRFIERLKFPQFLPFIIFLLMFVWVMPHVTYIRGWISWNYAGFEGKKTWPLFQEINDYLSKSGNGRVVYEHSPQHNVFGTERAFENLPHFAKRKTLEGLYMQSSISSPFIFYIQSEVSKLASGPFPQYHYTSLNVPKSLRRLQMFNVTEYIVRSPEAKKQAAAVPQFELKRRFENYEIYRLITNDGSYVVPLKNEPILYETDNWKQDFHAWFKNDEVNDVHLVYSEDKDHFRLKADSLDKIIRVPVRLPTVNIKETIKDEEIIFETSLVGYPHLIKVSYHPNWQVEGADKVYLISPSFMLVYPNQSQVKLTFSRGPLNYLGGFISIFGWLLVLGGTAYRSGKGLRRKD
jgi:uncharacterized membrane protein